MTHDIHIAGTEVRFPCEPGQKLLDAALHAGIEMPYSCRKGVCGNCAGRIASGEVQCPPTDVAPPGMHLYCQCVPEGDLEIVPEEGVVRRAGEEVHLTKTEFRLLLELANSPGRVLSREVLLERVWGHGYFADGRLVDVHIRRLRQAINIGGKPELIRTVRSAGYALDDDGG